MTEKSSYGVIRRILTEAGADPIRVELGAFAPGTPDFNTVDGWLEIKALKSWPSNPDRPVRLPTVKPEQLAWLIRRWSHGGAAFLLLIVEGYDWLLFDGDTAARFLGRLTQEEMFDKAIWKYTGSRHPEGLPIREAMQRAHANRSNNQ